MSRLRTGLTLGLLLCVTATPARAESVNLTAPDALTEVQRQASTPADDVVVEVRRLIAAEAYKDAETRATAWLEEAESATPPDATRAAMLLARADARIARNRLWRALFDLEKLIVEHPASELYLDAIEREYEVALRLVGGWKRRILGLRVLPTDGEGEELLIRVQERAPGTPVAERAAIALADYYYDKQQMRLAAEAYRLFLENHADSPRRERAMLRLIQSSLSRFKGPNFDATGLIEAQERLDNFQTEFPVAAERIGAEALHQRIRESLARRDLASAGWYQRRGDPVAERFIYRRLLETYPDTDAGRVAAERLTTQGDLRDAGDAADTGVNDRSEP